MPIALHMGWRQVLFANWPFDPSVIAPRIPGALGLDTHDDVAWVSIVAVRNQDVRSRYVPRSMGVTVPGVNVRTYVTNDERKGVFFFSLEAQGVLTVLGARFTHGLPYRYARVDLVEEDGHVEVSSRRRHPGARPARFAASYEPTGDRFHPKPGSLPEFLVERYRTFTETDEDTLGHTDVQHKPWPLYDAIVDIKENTLLDAVGLPEPDGDPFFLTSPGLDAIVTKRRRLEAKE